MFNLTCESLFTLSSIFKLGKLLYDVSLINTTTLGAVVTCSIHLRSKQHTQIYILQVLGHCARILGLHIDYSNNMNHEFL